MESTALAQLAALAHPHRLALFRLLMRRFPDQVPAGELARALGLPANSVSTYLAALRQAGLITQRRDGRSLLYRADTGGAGALTDYLVTDCCRGRPDLCPPLAAPASADGSMAAPSFNVLFVCTRNSARSIMAEALLRDLGGGRFNAFSAGTRPGGAPDPAAIEVLEAHGHDTTALRAKSTDRFRAQGAPAMDAVFTLCDRAANEGCPPWPGRPVSAHWGQPDPAEAAGPARRAAFVQAYDRLRGRIEALAALDIAALDRPSLQRALDDLAARKDPP